MLFLSVADAFGDDARRRSTRSEVAVSGGSYSLHRHSSGQLVLSGGGLHRLPAVFSACLCPA